MIAVAPVGMIVAAPVGMIVDLAEMIADPVVMIVMKAHVVMIVDPVVIVAMTAARAPKIQATAENVGFTGS